MGGGVQNLGKPAYMILERSLMVQGEFLRLSSEGFGRRLTMNSDSEIFKFCHYCPEQLGAVGNLDQM